MSRLPNLERQLKKAAERSRTEPRAVARPRRMGLAALLAAGLATSAVAVAANSGLLETGSDVPAQESGRPAAVGAADPDAPKLAGLRIADPAGGPPWGLEASTLEAGAIRCVRAGRVQAGVLGILGTDGVFGNDGRFHALPRNARIAERCGPVDDDGALQARGYGPPIPASGYTGELGGEVGGCRDTPLDSPTISDATRTKLQDLPRCETRRLRTVIYGYAGRSASTVTASTDQGEVSLDVEAQDQGAYLFVLPAQSNEPTLSIARRDRGPER